MNLPLNQKQRGGGKGSAGSATSSKLEDAKIGKGGRRQWGDLITLYGEERVLRRKWEPFSSHPKGVRHLPARRAEHGKSSKVFSHEGVTKALIGDGRRGAEK